MSLKNLYSQKSTKTNNNTLSYDRYSKTISADNNKYYNNYLKTVRDILQLRDDLDSNADLSQFVLYFGQEQVKWEDFYFASKQQYKGILNIVDKHPICIEGNIYHIRDNKKPLEKDQEPSLFLYGEKIVDGGKEKTIAINLVSEGFSLIKDYPNGCHAIIYGTVSLCRKQYPNYLNIVMSINDRRQIIKVE